MRLFESTTRIVLIVAALFGMFACTDTTGPNLNETDQGVVSTNLTTYVTGSDIIVTYSNMGGAATDWISIARTGDPANSYTLWQYTGGGTSGSVTFTAANLLAGTYEARAYYDWAGTNSFTIQQTSPTFTITGGTPVTVTTDKQIYSAGQTVTLTYSGMPGNQLDWVAVSLAGSPVTSVVAWNYTGGQTSGTQAFAGLPAGNYEARAYLDNRYSELASSTFTILGTTTITTDQPTYTTGQTVTVTYMNMPGNATDFVAIALAGSPATTVLAMAPTNGATNGSAPFTGLAAGNYEARAYQGGTFTILAMSTFSVTAPIVATVSTDSLTYAVGQTVTVSYSGLPGNPTDWISISTAGSADSAYVLYAFTNGMTSGTAQFTGLPAGSYEARAYVNNTFTVVGRSPTFTVSGGTCTVPTVMPVLGSLTSGDLVIAATAQVASVALANDLTTSILFTSLREHEGSPDYGSVLCALHATDVTLGPAGLSCRRNNVGTDTTGSTGQITIHYTVATFTSGVTVQRGEADTSAANPSSVALTAIDPASSFVLLNGMSNGGSGWGNNEFVRATLASGTSLQIQTSAPGTLTSWQVVTMAGASVQRGTSAFASTDLEQMVTVPSVPSGSLLLASYTSDNSSGIAAGALMLQSSLTSATTIDFKRALTGSTLSVSWEVVSLPFNTLTGVASLAAGAASSTIAAPSIAAATSVAISSTQSIFGQSGGSTTYNGTDVDLVGEAAATFVTGAGTVTVTRDASSASATFPWTIIDFAHNCAGQ